MNAAKKLRTGLVLAASVIAVSTSVYCVIWRMNAQNSIPEVDPTNANAALVVRLGKIEQLKKEDRLALVEEALKARDAPQIVLIDKLYSPDNQVRCYAASLLGAYRYDGAVRDLAMMITLQNEDFDRENPTTDSFGGLPALRALISIGLPSIPAMIHNLEDSDDRQVRRLSIAVIKSIFRDDEVMIRHAVQRAWDEQTGPVKKARLGAALKALPSERNSKSKDERG
jgi:hypothetical protein